MWAVYLQISVRINQWCDTKLRNSYPFRAHTTDRHAVLLRRRIGWLKQLFAAEATGQYPRVAETQATPEADSHKQWHPAGLTDPGQSKSEVHRPIPPGLILAASYDGHVWFSGATPIPAQQSGHDALILYLMELVT